LRLVGLLLTVGVMASAAAVVYLYSAVRRAAIRDEARAANAIVVFGAAEYSGRPSPVLRARLDHALTLYRRGLSSLIITTGGPGGDPRFTEAGVGRNYLAEHGVPPEQIVVEDQSGTTDQTVLLVAEVLLRNRMRNCVVVSDGYHLFRIKRQFASRGITAYGSPRPSSQEASHWTYLKQVFAYLLWRVGVRL
jgi:uncharacterized SAM-binding protein YcdF (DUF218 family)